MATYAGKLYISDNELPIGSTLYGTCSTAAGTAAKIVTLANFDMLMTGVTIHVKFTNSNSVANPTLNVNSTGAKNIYRYGTIAPATTSETSWSAGAVISFTYDGSAWMMNDWNSGSGSGYVHPTYPEATAAAVKVGRDSTGHVVIGAALTAPDVGAASSSHTHALNDLTGADDVKAIEALTGTSGYLKKTATNTWSLDTASYVPTTRTVNGHPLSSNVTVTASDVGLTAITTAQIDAILAQ